MRLRTLLVMLFGMTGVVHARPVIIEESAVLTPPAGVTYAFFGYQVGTNGEYALVVGEHPIDPENYEIRPFDALLYRRVNGTWTFQRFLAQGQRDLSQDWSYFPVVIGMKGNLASAALGEEEGATIYRFNGSDWVAAGPGAGLQEDVSIDGERILYGVGEAWHGRVFEPNGSGGWTSTHLQGQIRCCDDEFWGGPVDLLGDRAILGTPDTYDLEPQEIPIYYKHHSLGWQLYTRLQVPRDTHRLGAEVALHQDRAIVNGLRSGPYIWTDLYSEPTARLQAVNAYARNASTYKFAKRGELLLASAFDPDFNGVVINVFRPDASGQYQRLAILKPKTGGSINGDLEIDGNTVIAGSNHRAYIFTLPATFDDPAPRYEHFESGNGARWTPSAGAQFTVVRPTTVNGVYRQSSLAGDAHSVLGNTAASHQSIEADIRPTAFAHSNCWVGLATRYSNAQNYYYVTLRGTQTVDLKRMRDGAFTTLASAALPVQLNRNYRVRLESIGGTHRVFVDGRLLATAEDAAPVVPGNAAVVMYRAQADYDNVVASPMPRATIFADDFNDPSTYVGDWTHTGTGQWTPANGAFAQNSIGGDARALIGAPTDDQIVSVRVRPMAYAAGTGERWTGVLARYRDDRNYYYLTLRSSGTLSLRKLVNNVITPIATVPATVSLGSWHALRLEVTGNTLRAWLNGSLVIQATDTAHTGGRAGPVTYRAAAQFDDYEAYQP